MSWDKYLNEASLKNRGKLPSGDARNAFESDLGRIVFSPAIRRMHDKTQVFPLTTDDHIHSRLTHSMEVMVIGYSLGLRLCENEVFSKKIEKLGVEKYSLVRQIPIILENACLIHDIGNPPFGHFGEDVVKNFFQKYFSNSECKVKLTPLEKDDFIHFDGNAQGLRVVTHLQMLDDVYGLNLSFATLGAYLKYPNSDSLVSTELTRKKRGVFQSEKYCLDQIAEACDLKLGDGRFKRHPLAFLVEAADSICYLVMDIEDGFNKGWYQFAELKSQLEYLKKESDVEYNAIFNNVDSKIDSDMPRVVRLRINLISYLVKLALNVFIGNLEKIENGEYNKELIDDDNLKVAEKLRDFTKMHIFPKKEIQLLELTGDSVLSGLLNYYTNFIFCGNNAYKKRALGLISKSLIRIALLENGLKFEDGKSLFEEFEKLPDYYKLRVIVDYVTGMTDQFALDQYQKLSGQKI